MLLLAVTEKRLPRQIRSESLRYKLMRIMDGRQDLLHHAYHLNHLVHAERVCDWLLRHGFKGERLADWLRDKHQNSFLSMVEFIVAQVNRTARRPLVVGRDYLAKS